MVLQPSLAGQCLLALALVAACGKGQRGSQSNPPEPSPTPADAAVGEHAHEPVADGAPRPLADPPASDGAEELYVDGVRMRLQPADCTLTASFLDQQLDHRFEFPGACHFALGPDGQPWVVPTDHGKAVLVESSVPTEAGNCDTALQVVVVTERGPQLSREIQRVSGCGPGPWDEIMYHVLASDRVALGSGSGS